MTSPKSENDGRKQRILDAAADLIVHYGYDKTTVSDIARAAGISKGAIYLHFESKDALLEALIKRESLLYSERWFELIEADPLGGTMAGLYKNVLYALGSRPFMAALFKKDRHVLGSYLRKPDNLYTSTGSAGSVRYEFVKMMQSAGVVRDDLDPKVVAHIMNMLAYGLVAMDGIIDDEFIPPLDDTIAVIAEMMDRLLTPEEGANSEAGKAVIRQVMAQARQRFEQEGG